MKTQGDISLGGVSEASNQKDQKVKVRCQKLREGSSLLRPSHLLGILLVERPRALQKALLRAQQEENPQLEKALCSSIS